MRFFVPLRSLARVAPSARANPPPPASGIRFGSSEIYEVLDTFSPSASLLNGDKGQYNTIEDSLVVGQKIEGGADERVVLFVKMVEGEEMGEELIKEIRLRIRAA